MRIGLTSIFVDDQDQAERFYTEVLGFQVKTNGPLRPRGTLADSGIPRGARRGGVGAAPGRRAGAGVPGG
jgi:catechol 2,3-dioxygenase-like lactoylglutathione lyase family enzyme